ncbi:apolipoprotein D-like [Ruditapes philippinarum]|uniref:apolipoprotein D-like n=1 Tax=Ruditapes philippinarum TaxID=129788 RepID=UPI00295ACDB9|nr:apolipoprotein D-like [Ruditapes philippinarum]
MNAVQFACLLLFAGYSSAQVFSSGGCPNVNAQKNFTLNRYLGDWYEVYKFYAAFESGQSCAKAHYELKPDGHIKIVNSGFKDGKAIQAVGDAFVPDAVNNPAKLKLRFSSLAPYGNYWVLDTDYDNYTFIYSCSGVLGITHYEFAWILTRQPNITEEVKTKLFNEAKAFGIDTSNFKVQDRSGCTNNP